VVYRVYYAGTFLDDVERHVEYLASSGVSVDTIRGWYDRLFERIDSLDDWPQRCPVDDEQTRRHGRVTRKLNFGDYLVFYQLDDDLHVVRVVAFIHGARGR